MTVDKHSTKGKIIGKIQKNIPSFSDLLDEESFYIFAFLVVILIIAGAIILSKRVEIKDAGDHLE